MNCPRLAALSVARRRWISRIESGSIRFGSNLGDTAEYKERQASDREFVMPGHDGVSQLAEKCACKQHDGLQRSQIQYWTTGQF